MRLALPPRNQAGADQIKMHGIDLQERSGFELAIAWYHQAGNNGSAGRNPCRRHGELQRSRRYIALANPATDGLAGIPELAKSCALPGGVGDDPLLLLHQVQVV